MKRMRFLDLGGAAGVAAAAFFMALSAAAQKGPATSVPRAKIEAGYQPRRLALAVGINNFQDPQWRTLRYAENDAADMAAALRDPGAGQFDKVIELVEPWATTKSAILTALRSLANENMRPQDVVLVYISTHGTLAHGQDHNLRQYLVAYDTEFKNIATTGLAYDEILQIFNNLTSKRKALIFASCHSGMGKSELPEDIAAELRGLKGNFFVKPIESVSEATIVIGASSWGETAEENPAFQNDIYTHFLLEGMVSSDRNEDGAVSLSEAHDYARLKTYYFTEGKQRPYARSSILGTDPIILSGRIIRTAKPTIFSYDEMFAGSLLKLNGAEKGQLPSGVAASKGWNRIELSGQESGNNFFSGRLYLREGEKLDLGSVVEKRGEPKLGLIAGWRTSGSQTISEQVLPSMPMYGIGYQIGAFPLANTSLHIDASCGQASWSAGDEGYLEAEVRANLIESNLALIYDYRRNSIGFFAGPLIGSLALLKKVRTGPDDFQRNFATIYPGMVGGIKIPLNSSIYLDLADRVSWQYYRINGEDKPIIVNEAIITLRPFQTRKISSEIYRLIGFGRPNDGLKKQ